MAQNIYDDPEFFARYSQLNRQQHGLAGAPEWPTLRAMIGDCVDARVLDLGCGFGWFTRWASEHGARSALGVDLSERMLDTAVAMTDDDAVSYQRADLDTAEFDTSSYDLVFSSLTLHYIADLGRLMASVARGLDAGGRLVFSVEHPIYSAPTSQQFAEVDANMVWPLDNYLVEGERTTNWFTDGVVKHHRTVASYLTATIGAGLAIDDVAEFGLTDNPDDRHRPWFLLVSAHKR